MNPLRIKLLKFAFGAIIFGSCLNAVNAEISSISTRGLVKSGTEVLIAGVIINNENLTTTNEQCLVFRGRGLSVSAFPQLKDPFLTLKKGQVIIDSNDDWEDHPFAEALRSIGVEPGHPDDAALYSCLEPGAYTAIIRSANPGEEGLAIVEIIDVDFYDTSGILSVSLQIDSSQALSGDHLDVADNPSAYPGVVWDSSSRTLQLSDASGVIAYWDSLFTAGEKYQIKVNATGMGSEVFTLTSDGVQLGTVTGDGETLVYIGPINSGKFQISSNAGSSANVELSVRDAVELTWSANNVTSCTATGYGDWSNTAIPVSGGIANGDALIPIETDSQETLVFELSCTDGVKTETKTRQVSAAFCSDYGPVKLYNWEDLSFLNAGKGFSFPESQGTPALVSMANTETVAIKFNTKNVQPDQLVGAVNVTEAVGYAYTRDFAMASCPGQIENVPSGCKKRANPSGSLFYDIDDNDSGVTNRCEIKQGSSGETYYLNIKFRDDYCGPDNTYCETWIGTN